MEYEYGRDLNAICVDEKYKIPLDTLKKRKAKDEKVSGPWVKGCKAGIGYLFTTQEHDIARQEALSALTTEAKKKVGHLNNVFNHRANKEQKAILEEKKAETLGIEPKKKLVLAMAPEVAFSTKVNSAKALVDFERQLIVGCMTTEELQILKFEHDKKIAEEKLALEKEKVEIDTTYKAIGIELKQQELINNTPNDAKEDDGLLKALGGSAKEDWSNES